MVLAFLGIQNMAFVDVIDILMVALIIFFVFKWIRGTSAMNIFIAILLMLVVKVVASALDMKLMSALIRAVLDVGMIALIIIFQPEIRHFLIRLGSGNGVTGKGRTLIYRVLGIKENALGRESCAGIIDAVSEMSGSKTGALIVITHRDSLRKIIDTGDVIDAPVGSRLIQNLFFKNSPLHDGAVVITGDRIIAARCTLPITEKNVPAHFGMRHKAAIGISEESDATVVVVSEETGKISFVREGEVKTLGSAGELSALLSEDGQKQ